MSSPLRSSLDDEKSQDITARIAFILVRDGIPRKALISALDLDHSKPYWEQNRAPLDILHEVAVFLGVSLDWLITGKGRNTREPVESSRPLRPLQSFQRSAVVKGNKAHVINVNNYA